MEHWPLLLLAGFFAGAMNSLAGGGSFLTLPALIAAGVPSVQANASSTIALYPGGLAGTWAYRDGLEPLCGISLKLLGLVTSVGGLVGGVLLLSTSPGTFDQIIPWLLLIATLLLAFGRQVRAGLRRRFAIQPRTMLAIQFGLGVYGGYFGGAVGILMMAVWSLFGAHDVKLMNPAKVLLVAAANTMAVICFVVGGTIAWHPTVTMLIAASLGGYLGARVTLMLNSSQLRVAISIVNFVVTIVFFVTYMHR